jgi:predicted DNA-binding transcriptional regulator
MANDRAVGATIFIASIVGIIVYGILEYYWESEVLAVTAFLGIALLLGILAWIGYTMATTPPPEPITDIPDVPAPPKAGSSEKSS